MLNSIVRISFRVLCLLIMASNLSSCGVSKVEQCKILASVGSPKLNQNPTSEEILVAHQETLEFYRKISLSDKELKNLQDKNIYLLEKQIKNSQELILIEQEAKASPASPDILRRLTENSQKTVEASSTFLVLMKESMAQCPASKK